MAFPDMWTPSRLRNIMLTVSMLVLGLVAFAAMIGFVVLCERV